VAAPELSAKIARRIRAEGPVSIAAFMAMASHDSQDGYYASRDPLGRAGDFITAPEISQIFGELLGLWCAEMWCQMGRPDPVLLVELGPGRGVLMQDFLRAAAAVPGFRDALQLWLVEASPVLRREQQRRLAEAAPHFAADFAAIPPSPILLVANEFLDALPIRQLVRGRSNWAERLVALDDAGFFAFADGPESPAATLLVPPRLRDLPQGAIVEICPVAAALAGAIGERLAQHPGAALFVDYGYFPSVPGPTLAAIRRHDIALVLEQPGTADLSAHVDFATFGVAASAAGATVYGPAAQGAFLTALGAEARLASLSARATEPQREALAGGLHRLIDPGEMGNLFKVMAFLSPGLPVPPGFSDVFDPGTAASTTTSTTTSVAAAT
jgi:NADH dehydrogenase [ubiquinone] 1 alpha subcomplex assembly factor 7